MPVDPPLIDDSNSRELMLGAGRQDSIDVFIANAVKSDIVWGYNGQVPFAGEAHPLDGAMSARSLSVAQVADGAGVVVTVGYATGDLAYGQMRRPEPQPGSNVQWETTFRSVSQAIPVAVRHTIFTSAAPIGGDGTLVWDFQQNSIHETRMIVSAEWRIEQALPPGLMFDLAQEFNRLHVIEKKLWLFKSCSMKIKHQGLGTAVYDFRGTWEIDQGTPDPGDRGGGHEKDILFPGDLVYLKEHQPQEGFIRDPYHELRIIPPAKPTEPGEMVGPIRLAQRPTYALSKNGPGIIPGWPF